MKLSEYVQHDALGLAALVAAGEVTAAELAQTASAAMAAVNGSINAVIEQWPAPAADLQRSSAPFAGVPFLIKDVAISMAGQRLELGSRLAEGNVAAADSNLMRHFRQAGLVTIGRTSSPEMAFSTTTESVFNGPTRNPWDLRLSAGGSSGGAAAAVAAGIVPLAHATDAAGSIRVPAASCGLFGLKPTRGRVSNGPSMDEVFNGFGVQLGLSRSVRDSAALLDAILQHDVGEPYYTAPPASPYLLEVAREPGKLRIGVMLEAWSGQQPQAGIEQAAMDAARLCASLGHEVALVQPALGVAWEEFVHANAQVWCANLVGWIDGLCAATGRKADLSTLEAATLACYAYGRRASAPAFADALAIRNRVTRSLGGYFSDYDLLLTPTLPALPLAIGDYANGSAHMDGLEWTARVFRHSPYTPAANVAGVPAMSVPLGRCAEGLPIGVQFIAGFGREDMLFRLAGQLERAQPWTGHTPPVWAGNASAAGA
ncbi:amidase [Duganella sp. CY15W]|uniref:amidase n=1 Tax=Duganella sp. CY15W TaxID=2692172 RepID=UPI00136F81F7|nr:amidase [Duganella sp. CY15W]MYM29982.1 amidase [Duganella sp. CY15W]